MGFLSGGILGAVFALVAGFFVGDFLVAGFFAVAFLATGFFFVVAMILLLVIFLSCAMR